MTDWLAGGVLLATIICFGSFAWAARFHFRQEGGTPAGMQVLSLINLIGFAWFVYGLNRWPGGYRWGPIVVCGLSLLLFWWSIIHTRRRPLTLAFSPDAPAFLETTGPYQIARHPFYVSYLLFWMATALAIPGLLPWIVPAVMAMLYAFAATREEAKFINSGLEIDYQAYRMRTGMFYPLHPW